MNKVDKSRQTALITGASSGIGYELAILFAKDGHNLVLVARNQNKLTLIKKELCEKYGVQVKIIVKDLSLTYSAIELFDEINRSNIKINIIVNNAGIGCNGLFHEIDIEKDLEMINLNTLSLTYLTKLFVNEMIKEGGGKILNVASTGAYQPGPYFAVYYATKAYVLSFSEAITNELKNFGIKVTTFCPGATKTKFSKRAGKVDSAFAMDADVTAKIAYNAFKRNKKIVVPGIGNKLSVLLSRLLPRKISANMIGKVQCKLISDYKNNCL
jgi:uncharacterized protein